MGGQPPVNVRRVGERHNIVRQTGSGFGVDARVGPGRFPRDPAHLCLLGLFLITFAMGGIPHAGSQQFPLIGDSLNKLKLISVKAYFAAFKRSEVDSLLTDMKMSHDVIFCKKGRNEQHVQVHVLQQC